MAEHFQRNLHIGDHERCVSATVCLLILYGSDIDRSLHLAGVGLDFDKGRTRGTYHLLSLVIQVLCYCLWSNFQCSQLLLDVQNHSKDKEETFREGEDGRG